MPLYRCEQCGCIENTACSNYWMRKTRKQPLICSECDPEIGKWHGLFPKHQADGMLIDESGHLWSRLDQLPPHFKIVGRVPSVESSD